MYQDFTNAYYNDKNWNQWKLTQRHSYEIRVKIYEIVWFEMSIHCKRFIKNVPKMNVELHRWKLIHTWSNTRPPKLLNMLWIFYNFHHSPQHYSIIRHSKEKNHSKFCQVGSQCSNIHNAGSNFRIQHSKFTHWNATYVTFTLRAMPLFKIITKWLDMLHKQN